MKKTISVLLALMLLLGVLAGCGGSSNSATRERKFWCSVRSAPPDRGRVRAW